MSDRISDEEITEYLADDSSIITSWEYEVIMQLRNDLATAKLSRERERHDRWCQFMAAAMTNANFSAVDDIKLFSGWANEAMEEFDKRFPPEEPE